MLKKILRKIFQAEIKTLAEEENREILRALRGELDHYKNVLPAYRLRLGEYRAVNSELYLTIAEIKNKNENEQRTIH